MVRVQGVEAGFRDSGLRGVGYRLYDGFRIWGRVAGGRGCRVWRGIGQMRWHLEFRVAGSGVKGRVSEPVDGFGAPNEMG